MKNSFCLSLGKLVILILLQLWSRASIAQIVISPYTTFQDAVWSNKYGSKEDVSGDGGGYIGFTVGNLNLNVPDAISRIEFRYQGNVVAPIAQYWWPLTMEPGMYNYSYVYAKGTEAPFKENTPITIDVWTVNGHHATQTITNTTPKLKIGNVLQVADNKQQFRVYLRNDDTAPYIVDTVSINGKSLFPGKWVPPGGVGIFTIDLDTVLTECAPLLIKVNATGQNGQPLSLSAGIRVVDPEFPFGTWHSGGLNPDNINARKLYKELGISSIHGPSNETLLQKGYDEFGLRGMYEPEGEFNSLPDTIPATNKVRSWNNKKFIHLWNIDDEPDLNGKDIAQQILKNMTYWVNDKNTASYVNLAVMKKYNRYGWYADVVGMDHYAAPPAPNIIALTWVPIVGRAGELEEALDYTEYLKFNTEPRRMWTWCQLAPGPWDYEQDDFALNIQFWMHVMGGTKGVEWFVAQSHTKEEYPALWAEASKVVQQLNSIKYLCFYGERADVVTASTNKVRTRALIGPYSMVIPVVNNTTKYTWTGSFDPIRYNATIQQVNYSFEFELPDWISAEQVYRVGTDGSKVPVSMQNIGGSRYRINGAEPVHKESHIYVIAGADTEPPLAPTGLNVPDVVSETQYTLSWNEPFDNFGVVGYKIYYNGRLLDSTNIALYEVNGDAFRCPIGEWAVKAYDASGNLGPAAATIVNYNGTVQFMSVDASPEAILRLMAGEDTVISYSISGLGPVFQWQYSPDNVFWYNLGTNEIFDTINPLSLSISDVPDSLDGYYFRCMATDLCKNVLTTEPVLLRVERLSGISDKNALDFYVYPNPTNKLINIELLVVHPSTMMEIIDFSGKSVYLLKYRPVLDVSFLPAGSYRIKISTGKMSGVKGFVKD